MAKLTASLPGLWVTMETHFWEHLRGRFQGGLTEEERPTRNVDDTTSWAVVLASIIGGVGSRRQMWSDQMCKL